MNLIGRLKTITLVVAVGGALMSVTGAPAEADTFSCPAPPAGIKWYPGHYVLLDGIVRASNRSWLPALHRAHIAELEGEQYVTGVKIVVQWSAAEGARADDYAAGEAMIRDYITWVSAIGKRLWISFSHTQFGGYDPNNLQELFPDYIVTGSEYGLTKLADNRGIMARTWQQATMDRIIAKSRFYAQRFNACPSVEGISIGETSIGVTQGTDRFSNGEVLTQFKRFYSAARTQWPNSEVRLTANWLGSDPQMAELISHCASVDCAVGGPDVIPNQSIQANRIFVGQVGGVDYRNVIPFVAEIQSPELCGTKGCWTPRQLYDHAMFGSNGILPTQPRYFVWYRNTTSGGSEQKWHTGILPFIRSVQGRVFSTACPTAYPRCNTA